MPSYVFLVIFFPSVIFHPFFHVIWSDLILFALEVQIWDFNLGRSRDRNESYALEIDYGTNNEGFTIRSYNDHLNENSFAAMKALEDIGDTSFPSSNDDILSSNAHHVQSQTVSHLAIYFLAQFLPQYVQCNSAHSDYSVFSPTFLRFYPSFFFLTTKNIFSHLFKVRCNPV